MTTSIQERINGVQDVLDRFFPARGTSIADVGEMGGFDLISSLIEILNPQLVATEQTLNGLVERMKTSGNSHGNPFSMDAESIGETIFEAKKCAYLVGVIVGLRMMKASRQSINDLLFDTKGILEPDGNREPSEKKAR